MGRAEFSGGTMVDDPRHRFLEGRHAMTRDKAESSRLAPNGKGRVLVGRFAAVLLGALALALPAFYNGFPLLYADSMTYLDDGRIVARALFRKSTRLNSSHLG